MTIKRLSITGGPHGHQAKVELDGDEVHGLSRVELVAGVSDVTRVTLTHLVIATVDMDVMAEHAYAVKIHSRDKDEIWQPIAEATADTISQALVDCARQLDLNAARGVAHGGTI